MNTFFIRFFFSIVCIFIFLYVLSFCLFEIRDNKNFFGGVFSLTVTLGCIIFCNVIFWVNWFFEEPLVSKNKVREYSPTFPGSKRLYEFENSYYLFDVKGSTCRKKIICINRLSQTIIACWRRIKSSTASSINPNICYIIFHCPFEVATI